MSADEPQLPSDINIRRVSHKQRVLLWGIGGFLVLLIAAGWLLTTGKYIRNIFSEAKSAVGEVASTAGKFGRDVSEASAPVKEAAAKPVREALKSAQEQAAESERVKAENTNQEQDVFFQTISDLVEEELDKDDASKAEEQPETEAPTKEQSQDVTTSENNPDTYSSDKQSE